MNVIKIEMDKEFGGLNIDGCKDGKIINLSLGLKMDILNLINEHKSELTNCFGEDFLNTMNIEINDIKEML